MAATELTRGSAPRPASGLRRAWLDAYAAIWAATVAAAAVVVVLPPLRLPTRRLLALRLRADQTPAPDLGHVLALAAHNFPIAAWPVLLGVLGAHRQPRSRHVADALLAGCVSVNVLPVGAAVGAYGPAVLPYLPQLPLEWAALALGASAWMLQRHRAIRVTEGLALAALTGAVLICAAAVETLAVPHQPARGPSTASSGVNWEGGLHRGCCDIPVGPINKELKHERSGHGRPDSGQ
jgi:hypothetical protein